MTEKKQKKKVPRLKPWQNKFIKALKATRSVSHACREAERSRTHAYRDRKLNPKFAALWEEAIEKNRDDLEASAMERAIGGWEEPVFFQGREIGTVTKYSAGLTIFMLKCQRPDTYGDRENIESAEDQANAARELLLKMMNTVPEPKTNGNGNGKKKETPPQNSRITEVVEPEVKT